MDVALIQELYRYNRWANDRVFEAVAALSPQDFTKGLCNRTVPLPVGCSTPRNSLN